MATKVVPLWESMQYDGTNGDEVCHFMTPPAEKISEEGGGLVYEVQGFQQQVNEGDYVLREGLSPMWGSVISAEEYKARYYELPEPPA